MKNANVASGILWRHSTQLNSELYVGSSWPEILYQDVDGLKLREISLSLPPGC